MAFIPDGAEWYIADIVLEVRPQDAGPSQAWVNTHRIKADSPDEAYAKAEQLGRDSESTYENIEGKRVDYIFRGIGDLQVVFGKLEDGVELCWKQYFDIRPEKLEQFVPPKDELAVFRPTREERDPRFRPIGMPESTG